MCSGRIRKPTPAGDNTRDRGRRRVAGLLAILVTGLAACAPAVRAPEITREHAIEIARHEVSFTPDQIDAVRAMSAITPVWRVTMRGRRPGQPPELFDTVVVDIDRRTGAIVSISRP
jgi:hypothetical protein